ncbi:hypothetical protein MRX96_024794 [Rhipicephalus microplus]
MLVAPLNILESVLPVLLGCHQLLPVLDFVVAFNSLRRHLVVVDLEGLFLCSQFGEDCERRPFVRETQHGFGLPFGVVDERDLGVRREGFLEVLPGSLFAEPFDAQDAAEHDIEGLTLLGGVSTSVSSFSRGFLVGGFLLSLLLRPGLAFPLLARHVLRLEGADQLELVVLDVLLGEERVGLFLRGEGGEHGALESASLRVASHEDVDTLAETSEELQKLVYGGRWREALGVDAQLVQFLIVFFVALRRGLGRTATDLGAVIANLQQLAGGLSKRCGYDVRLGRETFEPVESQQGLYGHPAVVFLQLSLQELVAGQVEVAEIVFNLSDDFGLQRRNTVDGRVFDVRIRHCRCVSRWQNSSH